MTKHSKPEKYNLNELNKQFKRELSRLQSQYNYDITDLSGFYCALQNGRLFLCSYDCEINSVFFNQNQPYIHLCEGEHWKQWKRLIIGSSKQYNQIMIVGFESDCIIDYPFIIVSSC